MTDYISRDDFISDAQKRFCENCELRKGIRNGKMQFIYEIGGVPCRACPLNDALVAVEDYPPADVREVVRCKDCKLRVLDFDEPGMVYCQNIVGGWVSDDFYCAYGARMDGGEK